MNKRKYSVLFYVPNLIGEFIGSVRGCGSFHSPPTHRLHEAAVSDHCVDFL